VDAVVRLISSLDAMDQPTASIANTFSAALQMARLPTTQRPFSVLLRTRLSEGVQMRRKKRRDQWLWEVRVRGCDDTYWIIAGEKMDSATKKATTFFARLAKKNNRPPYALKSVTSRGTIDVF
jgi:hypothetical protein